MENLFDVKINRETLAHTLARLVWFLIDGAGDVAVPALGHRTPLQAAPHPAMDRVAACGVMGLMDPVEPGVACGSDTAHMAMFGYDPRKYYRGRGAFESMGAGLEMCPGDIAFKSNFATLDIPSGIVLQRRADRNFEGLGPELCAALDGMRLPSFPNHTISVKYATEHRCGVRVRGPRLSDTITGTDPLRDNLPLVMCKPAKNKDHDGDSIFTSQLVNELTHEMTRILSEHPINIKRRHQGKPVANCVLLRGCGSCLDVTPFEQLHGLRSFMIAPTCIIAGLGMTVRMDVIAVPGATGDYHTDLGAKGRAVLKHILSGQYDLGFVHIKAVDDAGHDHNMEYKMRFLTEIDAMIGEVIDGLNLAEQNSDTRFVVCITSDHSTPLFHGDHSHEPVAFAACHICDLRNPQSPSTATFDEISAAQGSLGRFPGSQVMPLLLALSGRSPSRD